MPSDTAAPKDKAAANASSWGSVGGVGWTGGTVWLFVAAFMLFIQELLTPAFIGLQALFTGKFGCFQT